MERSHHFQGLLIVAALIALGGLYLWQNHQPALTVAVPAASPTPANVPPEWETALEAQLASAQPPPTADPNATTYLPPTLPPTPGAVSTLVVPVQVQFTPWPTATPPATSAALPQQPGPTRFPTPTGIAVVVESTSEGFQPPPEQVPLRLHANDHFLLMRPVDASANSQSLFYYPFGSDGPGNEWRIHHGIDMPNPVGKEVRAAGSGTVIWAGNGSELVGTADLDIYPSYGNVVIIEHDFGYRGQKIWTLYAHLAAFAVEQGQSVQAGEIVGLSGGTGDVSGPHVHMEVRLGENKYFAVVNPLLWIAPYMGHGVIAGRVTTSEGTPVEDAVVTLSRRGRIVETTTTYLKPKTDPNQRSDWHVVPDPSWQENFVLGDVPAGDYQITVTVNGLRYERGVTVRAGTVNFVTLGPSLAATPQPVTPESRAP